MYQAYLFQWNLWQNYAARLKPSNEPIYPVSASNSLVWILIWNPLLVHSFPPWLIYKDIYTKHYWRKLLQGKNVIPFRTYFSTRQLTGPLKALIIYQIILRNLICMDKCNWSLFKKKNEAIILLELNWWKTVFVCIWFEPKKLIRSSSHEERQFVRFVNDLCCLFVSYINEKSK